MSPRRTILYPLDLSDTWCSSNSLAEIADIDVETSLIKGQNDEIWSNYDSYCKLGDLDCQITSGKDKVSDGIIPLYGSTGIIGKIKSPTYDEPLVLIARVGSIGNVQYVNTPCGVTDNTIIVRVGLKAKFVYYYLRGYNFKRITSGTTQPLITASDVKRILLPKVSKNEESKITNTLDAFENSLMVEREIVTLLLKQKEYLLRQLFI